MYVTQTVHAVCSVPILRVAGAATNVEMTHGAMRARTAVSTSIS
jgi:hypothetical protein